MKLPRFIKVQQHFTGPSIDDVESAVRSELTRIKISEQIKPGMRVAITAGSRGIANIAKIIRETAAFLKISGAEPFIIPAMGSHGGATAEGQVEVLESYGITEEFCKAPILSSMEVVQIGVTEQGTPVYVDKYAWEADAVLIIARIKVHTDFKSPIGIESGIMKMAAIGMGKHKQALALHSSGITGIRDYMPEVARLVLKKANVLCGLAIVENAFEQTAIIEAIPTEQIENRERELLKQSASFMPKLPVNNLDILLVDQIGKNFSGTGMDTNIIGRMRILGVKEPEMPSIKYIIASDLSEESHGNALGIGLADLTTRRLFEKIDFQKTNENVITSTFLTRAAIPIVMESDREALIAALRCNWDVKAEDARIIRIPNTLHLEHLYVSEALLPEIQNLDHVRIVGTPEYMSFDEQGYLR
ncbi:lactate racemase domain-containing protein [Paenibacillus filicis]|uniref:Lactate racemase domain-containing protein n=1 Tax=Paenibacillus gyeongsangnamensis TaxID=3388067 RepID=A0ABT4QJN4_9BACL|nr:lactate racemase domain-containing protein [Paenibacillus filicis]MCZ8517089.1 lactate racemase domain-containing protein [Paenibacillus filicis]